MDRVQMHSNIITKAGIGPRADKLFSGCPLWFNEVTSDFLHIFRGIREVNSMLNREKVKAV